MSLTTKGFTLIELSIVLVIIGLIVGGIVGGQSLIHSSKINGIIKEVNQYKTAIRAFELKYDTLPGDMRNAWDYWGLDCGVDSFSCNGDGDSIISAGEGLGAWHHLSLSKIISGNYRGFAERYEEGNYPASKINKAGYNFASLTEYNIVDNFILFGYPGGGFRERRFFLIPVISPMDAQYLDNKFDNNSADTGKILTVNGLNSTQCVTTSAPITYLLGNKDIECIMRFRF